MTKENCPIVIVYYGIQDSYSRNILLKLLPALKELNFNKVAIDEAEDKENIELLDFYGLRAVGAIVNDQTSHNKESNTHQSITRKFFTSTYSFLKMAKNLNFSLNSIDMQDFGAYSSLKKKFHDSYKKFSSITSHKFFMNKNLNEVISTNEMDSFSYGRGTKLFVSMILKHKFITDRNTVFASNIKKLCSEGDGGIIVLLKDLHTEVSTILLSEDYDVYSYWLTRVMTPESLILKKYGEVLPGHFNDVKDFSSTIDSQELAIELIKLDLGYYSVD